MLKGSLNSWVSEEAVRDIVKECMAKCTPMTIIELGTFSGVGMQEIANFVSTYSDEKANLYTFDGLRNIDYRPDIDEFSYCEIDDLWPDVVLERQERLKVEYPHCQVHYIEGIIRDTLQKAMPEIGEWDFCFHDSIHSANLQIEDFKVMQPYSRVGGIIL